MADGQIRVGIILCPDEKLAGVPVHASWPGPAGVTVRFQPDPGPPAAAAAPAAGAAAGAVEVVTEAGGLATSPDLADGPYLVEADLPAARLDAWRAEPAPLRVKAGPAKQRHTIRLIPPADRRLLPLLLLGEDDAGNPVPLRGARVKIKTVTGGGRWRGETFTAADDGHVYALVPDGPAPRGGKVRVAVEFEDASVDGRGFKPRHRTVTFGVPAPDDPSAEISRFYYTQTPLRATSRGISITPKIKLPSGESVSLTGATVTAESVNGPEETAQHSWALGPADKVVHFPNVQPGVYTVTVRPPVSFQGWPLTADPKPIGPLYLSSGEHFEQTVVFDFKTERIQGSLETPGNRPLDNEVQLQIYGPDGSMLAATRSGAFTAEVPSSEPLKVRLAAGPAPTIDGIPLEMSPTEQDVVPPPGSTTVSLQYEHAIIGQAMDETGEPMRDAVVAIHGAGQAAPVAMAVTDHNGNFMAGVPAAGDYFVAFPTEGGEPLMRKAVTVQSIVNVGRVVFRQRRGLGNGGPPPPGGTPGPGAAPPQSGNGQTAAAVPGAPRFPREAITDLAAYPVLTEEISTTGPPAPAAGGGSRGPGYGQAVDQVIRDVLGWRPSNDAAGFQAALTGAFKLTEVEGHTEWAWQQRGFAVQADLGALTGPQASIYARAKSALEQISPLLAGLTAIDPARFPPQDLEAIRTVVASELTELVNELGVEGGPRIQRVDELFTLLLGTTGPLGTDPEGVAGQLGILRDRFGLTPDEVRTLDEERNVTNFRVIVEQALALQATWGDLRLQLANIGPETSLGTILILLSRSLAAVGESVDDLKFALDSVFIDAAQQQVILLKFQDGHQPILLSDLLDWIVRASRDEGPRLVQDAGKDGVFAFAPVLTTLQGLVQATRDLIQQDNTLPPGMRTPRVRRALAVLVDQLNNAVEQATAVHSDPAPEISAAWVPGRFSRATAGPAQVNIILFGTNFRSGATAQLSAEDRPDFGLLVADQTQTTVVQTSMAHARFTIPTTDPTVTWQVSLINSDDTRSNAVEVSIPG